MIDVPNADEQKGFNVVTKSIFATDKLELLGWRAQSNMLDGLNHTIEAV